MTGLFTGVNLRRPDPKMVKITGEMRKLITCGPKREEEIIIRESVSDRKKDRLFINYLQIEP